MVVKIHQKKVKAIKNYPQYKETIQVFGEIVRETQKAVLLGNIRLKHFQGGKKIHQGDFDREHWIPKSCLTNIDKFLWALKR